MDWERGVNAPAVLGWFNVNSNRCRIAIWLGKSALSPTVKREKSTG
jgi:hypothetical protein